MKKKDIILIVVVISLILVATLVNKNINAGNAKEVEIYVDNQLYKKYPLDKSEKITIEKDGHVNDIHIHDGGVEIEHANCPDKVCVNTGFINKTGQEIVCLPYKVVVKIVGGYENEKEHDIIAK
ncbi:NusG domain II-containing protein [Peptostreptococcus faecalis]|uniref:NusG domain II-containing protein n=1 Tax=Peptostreptococcus faecalis TaxID=2045015 RepID=UPI000C7E02AA|nr:NusG domain II-containing protein [Peptostreptococcus faecalis]